jgi:periplasmic copper chaperone A
LPDHPHTTLHFPVVQECEQGIHRWIEIPEAGKAAGDYREPAPALMLVPRK